MIDLLKIIHLLCLLLAGAALIGNGVLMRRLAGTPAPHPPVMQDSVRTLARIGIVAIVVLWLSGIPLAAMTGAFQMDSWMFQVKLLGALILLGIVPGMYFLRSQMVAGKRPANPGLMRGLTMATRALLLLVIVLAVLVFH